MKNCVIVSAVRTAIGSFNGSLASTSAIDLGATVIKAAIERAKIDSQHVDEVIMGNVLQAGLGQNPARQALLKSGLAETEVIPWIITGMLMPRPLKYPMLLNSTQVRIHSGAKPRR